VLKYIIILYDLKKKFSVFLQVNFFCILLVDFSNYCMIHCGVCATVGTVLTGVLNFFTAVVISLTPDS